MSENTHTGFSIAVVDDDEGVVNTIAQYLRKLECDVRTYTAPEVFLRDFAMKPVNIAVVDLRMPTVDGLAVLKTIKETNPSTDVIVITGQADKEAAVDALKLGAFDFFEKPVHAVELLETVRRTVKYRQVVLERDRYAEQVSFLSAREAHAWGIDAFVGKSAAVACILDDIRRLQQAQKTFVLIQGESGTGKELVARAIHFGSARSSRPFVPLNCSAMPHDLAESMLFGHVKGAFTGAVADKKGAFDLADGGAIFLDEIGDMPPLIQAKLLRVIEDGLVTPIGATAERRVDVRVIAATNCNLAERMSRGTFRKDLYHRLAVYSLQLSPLREHREDIRLLVEHYAEKLSSEMGMAKPEFEMSTLEAFNAYDFPGNVRELKNMVERALINAGGRPITSEHVQFPHGLPADMEQSRGEGPPAGAKEQRLPVTLEEAERAVIERAMSQAGGNVSKAASLLGISRSKLYRHLDEIRRKTGDNAE